MRATQTCPKCAGKKFAVTDEWRQPDERALSGMLVVAAVTVEVYNRRRKALGSFESWICLGCGYTELYAHGLQGVEALAQQHPEQLRIVDAGPPERGPYR
jgi:predicted nucleic-acid-binding Zn-ribbon protein